MTYAKQFLIAAALVLTACDETSRPVAPTDEPEPPIVAQADQGISQLARAAAAALGAPAVRHSILAAMRASTAVEHRLLLADYLRSSEGTGLLTGSAAALDIAEDELLARVEEVSGDIELAIAVPLREHRLGWRGTAHIGVAGAWDSDKLDLIVHEPDGDRQRATTVNTLQAYDALFLIRPQENWGTRIDRQADVPGPVIQDAGDGEQALIWTHDAGDGSTPMSVDVGKYESEEALADALAAAGGVYHSGAAGCAHSAGAACDGTVRGGTTTTSRWVTYSPIWLHHIQLHHATEFPFPEEIEVTVYYRGRNGRVRGSAMERFEGVFAGPEYEREKDMLQVSPKRGGYPFSVKAVETDWLRDDHLGTASLTVDTQQGDIATSWWFTVNLTW